VLGPSVGVFVSSSLAQLDQFVKRLRPALFFFPRPNSVMHHSAFRAACIPSGVDMLASSALLVSGVDCHKIPADYLDLTPIGHIFIPAFRA
jgi:hypothetical protein